MFCHHQYLLRHPCSGDAEALDLPQLLSEPENKPQHPAAHIHVLNQFIVIEVVLEVTITQRHREQLAEVIPDAAIGLPAPFVVDSKTTRVKIIGDEPPLAQFEPPFDSHDGINKVRLIRKIARGDSDREACGKIQVCLRVKGQITDTCQEIKLYVLAAVKGV